MMTAPSFSAAATILSHSAFDTPLCACAQIGDAAHSATATAIVAKPHLFLMIFPPRLRQQLRPAHAGHQSAGFASVARNLGSAARSVPAGDAVESRDGAR